MTYVDTCDPITMYYLLLTLERMRSVVGTKYGWSVNGWINADLFEAWFIEHFSPNAVSACPLFLLLDGHSTHYQPQVIMEHQCIIHLSTSVDDPRKSATGRWCLRSRCNGARCVTTSTKTTQGRSSIRLTSAPCFQRRGMGPSLH